MKFRRLLIIGVAVLSLGSLGSISGLAHADPTQAEKNASLAVDNALTKKYGDHVPTSASINAENDLDREFEGSSNSSSSSSGSNSQADTSSNNQQVHNSQPSTSKKSVNTASNSNKSNNNINNKIKNKNSRHKNNKASNKKNNHKSKDHKTKSVIKARGSKNHERKTNHHFLGIGIAVVVILAILGLCIKLFSYNNKH